jgi:hypothetical protein
MGKYDGRMQRIELLALAGVGAVIALAYLVSFIRGL